MWIVYLLPLPISPNNPRAPLLEELGYSDMRDSFEGMKIRSKEKAYNFPYLYDGDTQKTSLKYGPVATPQVYVFDKTRTLQYLGRLDGSEKPGTADAEDLRLAVDALLEGDLPKVPVTKTFGCSTKCGLHTGFNAKLNAELAQKSVEISKIDEEGIKALPKNESSNKLTMLNIWATWCGPGVIEYPEFINVHSKFKKRDFQFVTLSADSPTKENKVLQFLKRRKSRVKNYLFND